MIGGGKIEVAEIDGGIGQAIRAGVGQVQIVHGDCNGVAGFVDSQEVILLVGDGDMGSTTIAIELETRVAAVFGSGLAIIERVSYICYAPTLDCFIAGGEFRVFC